MYLTLLCSIFHTVIDVFVVTHSCLQLAGLNLRLVKGSGGKVTEVSLVPAM
jgi:hypothetical protein